MNYQQLGDAHAANLAISVELQATETHLRKAWRSGETYYRLKYKSWRRARAYFEWLSFRLQDMVWGNGESIPKLIRSIVVILGIIGAYDVIKFGDLNAVHSYWHALAQSPEIFLGISSPANFPALAATVILSIRLIVFGALISIFVKRYSRR